MEPCGREKLNNQREEKKEIPNGKTEISLFIEDFCNQRWRKEGGNRRQRSEVAGFRLAFEE